MTSQHVNPEEAIQAFVDVGAEIMIPMHYGTFRLADDTAREALDRMESARMKHEISEDRIRTLSYGETLIVQPENHISGE
jgi:L-ascorbate metabolism protein UlaG (beta-lactamase superfamily)